MVEKLIVPRSMILALKSSPFSFSSLPVEMVLEAFRIDVLSETCSSYCATPSSVDALSRAWQLVCCSLQSLLILSIAGCRMNFFVMTELMMVSKILLLLLLLMREVESSLILREGNFPESANFHPEKGS